MSPSKICNKTSKINLLLPRQLAPEIVKAKCNFLQLPSSVLIEPTTIDASAFHQNIFTVQEVWKLMWHKSYTCSWFYNVARCLLGIAWPWIINLSCLPYVCVGGVWPAAKMNSYKQAWLPLLQKGNDHSLLPTTMIILCTMNYNEQSKCH